MKELSHEEAYSELAAVALDAVSAEYGRAVREHAQVCPECGPELAKMEETVATLGYLVPAGELDTGRSAGIRSRLVARAKAERESQVREEAKHATPAQPVRQPTPVIEMRPRRLNNWLALAATLALVATGAQLLRVTADRNSMRERLVEADTLVPRTDSLTAAVNRKDSMIAAMAGRDVKVVALVSEGATQPNGRMMWNRESHDWIMVTYGLRPPRPGMTYQVWLVTDDAKISAGTFLPDREGKTVMHAHYELPREALRAVAITEEPQGGVPAPTGPMVVVGSA